MVCCLRKVKRNLLHVRMHEPARLFALAPYASLNTSPVASDGTLSAATQVSQSVSQGVATHAPARLTRPGTYRMGRGYGWEGRARLSGVTVGT